jgi:hypothetical protein
MTSAASFNAQDKAEQLQMEIEEVRQEMAREQAWRIESVMDRLCPVRAWGRENEELKVAIRKALAEKEAVINNVFGHSFKNQSNYIITATTQTGKTKMLTDILGETGMRSISVVSCDNRDDQVQQLSKRLHLAGIENLKIKDIKLTAAGNVKKVFLERILKHYNEHKKLTFVLLNNTSQCSKLSSVINQLFRTLDVERYQVFHDEADLINKSDYVEANGPEKIAKVHKDWVEHFNNIKVFHQIKFVKRVWISATPENCSLIKDVKAKHVFVLPQHPNYRTQNIFEEWSNQENTDALVAEVERIKEECSKEVILYCTDRLNSGQAEISRDLCRIAKCPVVSYNGSGSIIYKPRQNPRLNKTDAISDILAELEQDFYTGPVIVVGHALMSRGISFVSSKSGEKPLSATVMFYEGSRTAHAVGIAQRIGRISGNSRPDLPDRVLYCSKEIHECYNKYLANQIVIYETLRSPENQERFVSDILVNDEIIGLKELDRKVDRNELGKAITIYSSSCSKSSNLTETTANSDESVSDDDESADTEKMKGLVRRWIKTDNSDSIAKIFRKIYSSPGSKMLSSEVNAIVSSLSKVAQYFGNLTSSNHSNKWCLVFSKDSQFHYIRPEAVEFANTL